MRLAVDLSGYERLVVALERQPEIGLVTFRNPIQNHVVLHGTQRGQDFVPPEECRLRGDSALFGRLADAHAGHHATDAGSPGLHVLVRPDIDVPGHGNEMLSAVFAGILLDSVFPVAVPHDVDAAAMRTGHDVGGLHFGDIIGNPLSGGRPGGEHAHQGRPVVLAQSQDLVKQFFEFFHGSIVSYTQRYDEVVPYWYTRERTVQKSVKRFYRAFLLPFHHG